MGWGGVRTVATVRELVAKNTVATVHELVAKNEALKCRNGLPVTCCVRGVLDYSFLARRADEQVDQHQEHALYAQQNLIFMGFHFP